MDASLASIGHRIYEVRRALGPDARHEMPQRAFARLLNETAERLYPREEDRQGDYDSSVIARLEAGERRITVQDITVVAVVDLLQRGLLWLCWDVRDDPTRRAETDEETAARIGVTMARPSGESADALFAENEERERRTAAKKGGRGGRRAG